MIYEPINKLLKNKLLFLFLLILIIETSLLLSKINENLEFSKTLSSNETQAISVFNNNLKYLITPKFNNLAAIKFVFGTYKRKNTEILEFYLYDDAGNIVRKSQIDTKNLKDNKEYILKFKKITNSKDKKYFFEIKSLNGTNENSVAIYKKNNETLYDLGYKSLIKDRILFSLIIFILGINLFFTKYFYKNQNLKKEKIFLILASTYCALGIFTIPPFAINDENFHFYKSYAIATKQITNPAYIPKSVVEFTKTIGFSEYINNHGKIDMSDIRKASQIQLSKQNKEKVDSLVVAIYNPISYIPQVIGILIGSFLNLPILYLFYLGRVIILITWLTIMYIAIKNAPDKIQNILLVIGLFPSSVQESFPYSTDVLIDSFSFLYISYLFKLYLDKGEKFNWKYGLIFFLGVFMPTTAKITYFLFILLIFIIPFTKFKNRKMYFSIIFFIFIITLLTSVVWSKFSPSYIHNTSKNLVYLKSNLTDYIKTFLLTTREYLVFYIENSIGILGWHDTKLPFIITYGYIVLLGLHIFSKNIMKKKDYKFWVIILVVLIGTYGGISTALYIAWTQIGAKYIEGVQGRYFLPLLPILAILLSQKKILLQEKLLNLNTNLFLNFALAYTMFCILQRFYI